MQVLALATANTPPASGGAPPLTNDEMAALIAALNELSVLNGNSSTLTAPPGPAAPLLGFTTSTASNSSSGSAPSQAEMDRMMQEVAAAVQNLQVRSAQRRPRCC